jgi:hypothetical protein
MTSIINNRGVKETEMAKINGVYRKAKAAWRLGIWRNGVIENGNESWRIMWRQWRRQ